VVRGKVESLLMADMGVPVAKRRAAGQRARKYFALADSYTRRKHRRGIVLVTGPSGSGKSVLAGVVAARLNAALLSTDMVRIDLYGKSAAGDRSGLGQDRYTPEARERVYDAIARQAEAFVRDGQPVVIDGTYIERARRVPVLGVAARTKTPLLVVECSAPDEVVRQRQKQREGEAWTTSEGRWEVYMEQKAAMEPAIEVPEGQRVAVDTTLALGEQVEAVEARLTTVGG
jgi:predicted kinase